LDGRLRRRFGLVAVGVLVLAGVALLWSRSVPIARSLVFGAPSDPAETAVDAAALGAIQADLRGDLSAAGLDEAWLVSETALPREDRGGTWNASELRWRLPRGRDPQDLAGSLESLVAVRDPNLELYVIEPDDGDTEIRIYAGSRLAALLVLEPAFPEWPSPGGNGQGAPLLALVLREPESEPQIAAGLLDLDVPFAVALSPYDPYALRMARAAVVAHKEVLAEAVADLPPTKAAEAVPFASGLLATGALAGDPAAEAQGLRDRSLYVLDVSRDGLSAGWLRALSNAGVPLLRGIRGDGPDRNPDVAAAAAERRFRSAAVRLGRAVLVLDARGTAPSLAVLGLQEGESRGFRPAFVAETARRP
jgi:hypothetical protein